VEQNAEFLSKKNSKEEGEKRKQMAAECIRKGMSHSETVTVLKRELGMGVSPTTFTRLTREIQGKKRRKPAKGKYGVLVPAKVLQDVQRPRTVKELVLGLQEVMREQEIRLIEITQNDAKITKVEVLRF